MQIIRMKLINCLLIISLISLIPLRANAQNPSTAGSPPATAALPCSTITTPHGQECDKADICFDARSKGSLGETRILRRSGKIRIYNLNPIKYDYVLGRVVTPIQDPVELTKLGFLPPIPSPPSGSAPKPAASADINQNVLQDLRTRISSLQTRVDDLKATIRIIEKKILEQQIERDRAAVSPEKFREAGEKIRLLQFDLETSKNQLAPLEKEIEQLKKQLTALETPSPIDQLQNAFNELLIRLDTIEENATGQNGVAGKARQVRNSVENAKMELEAFVSGSDSYTPQDILKEISRVNPLLDGAISLEWPDQDAATVITDLRRLENDLTVALPTQHAAAWSEWGKLGQNLAAYQAAIARVQALRKYIEDDIAKVRQEWNSVRPKLSQARTLFQGICMAGQAAFIREETVKCDGPRDVKYTLAKTERTATAKTEPEEIAVARCSHPISLSTGVAFTTRDEDEFVLINQVTSSSPPTLDSFKIISSSKRSRFRPMPLLLVNARIHDLTPELGLHVSFGAGVDIKTGNTGSDVEFLFGPSLMLRERFLLTGGVHVGRELRLADGFQLRTPVPNELTAPPTFKRYTAGFGFALTFRIK
jgi:predicted  nucleic acid-binding Zn-ribbon protein